jgi:transposase
MQPRDWFLPTLGENLVMSEFLTSSERASLKSAHSIERDRKIGDRMKVVLLADQGESLAVIAKFLLIDEQTARRHLKDYFDNDKLGGSSGGSQGKLGPAQTEKLKALLAAGDVPTAKAAVAKVKSLFGIKFSISGMTDWLKRSRFSFKKSQPEPANANPQAQAEFIDTYRTLKDGLPEGEAVFFLDAAHPKEREEQLNHSARLYLKASCTEVDRFFMQVRRALTMAERGVISASADRRLWFGKNAYNPAVLVKLLEIFRTYFNYCEVGQDKKTDKATTIL